MIEKLNNIISKKFGKIKNLESVKKSIRLEQADDEVSVKFFKKNKRIYLKIRIGKKIISDLKMKEDEIKLAAFQDEDNRYLILLAKSPNGFCSVCENTNNTFYYFNIPIKIGGSTLDLPNKSFIVEYEILHDDSPVPLLIINSRPHYKWVVDKEAIPAQMLRK